MTKKDNVLGRLNIWHVTCASSEDSDQPALLRRLIRNFNGRILDKPVIKYSFMRTKTLIRLRRGADLSEYSFGTYVRKKVFTPRGSCKCKTVSCTIRIFVSNLKWYILAEVLMKRGSKLRYWLIVMGTEDNLNIWMTDAFRDLGK